MCTYLTYKSAEYQARSVSREVPDGQKQPEQFDSAVPNSILFDALLPFPEAAAAVVALVSKRLGREAPV